MVVGNPIPVGNIPFDLAVTPDGKSVYVSNGATVSVIDTASNMVVGNPIPVGGGVIGLAVTPDGKSVYAVVQTTNSVSVIDTASNMVVGNPIPVGISAAFIAIIPPPQGVPFLVFNAKLEINFSSKPNRGAFDLQSTFTLSSTTNNGIHPDTEPVKLQVGPFITTIPAGSFRPRKDGSYTHEGVHRWRVAKGEDRADGNFALRIPRRGEGCQFKRNHKSGAGVAGDWRLRWLDLGQCHWFRRSCYKIKSHTPISRMRSQQPTRLCTLRFNSRHREV